METTHLLIMPTMRCDRGCAMCSEGSTATGQDMEEETLGNLIQQIIGLSGGKVVYVLGGGEPLLYNSLYSHLTPLLENERCFVNVITSGCASEKDTGYEVLKELATDPRVQLSLSYHGFNGDEAAKRIMFSIPLLEEDMLHIGINFVADWDESNITSKATDTLESLLHDLGYKNSMSQIDESQIRALGIDADNPALASLENEWFISDLFFKNPKLRLEEGILMISDCDTKIEISSMQLKVEVGRAQRLSGDGIKWCYLKGCCEAFGNEKILKIDASGNIWPCQTVLKEKILSIGTFPDMSLKEALDMSEEAIRVRKERHYKSQKSCQCPCFHCLPT